MEEKNWNAALAESRRARLQEPVNQAAHLMEIVAQVRLGQDLPAALQTLEDMAAQSDTAPLSVLASYEAARLRIVSGDWSRVFQRLEQVFLNSSNNVLFLRSGCTLSLLLRQHPELQKGKAALQKRLLESEPQWDATLREECALPRPSRRMSLFSLPGEAIVAFYRYCVSPAIGARCSLEPSCSKFFLEASRKHGLLAFPIIADRLVREPSVVAERRVTVLVGEKRRIADPLDDHDAWLSAPSNTGKTHQ